MIRCDQICYFAPIAINTIYVCRAPIHQSCIHHAKLKSRPNTNSDKLFQLAVRVFWTAAAAAVHGSSGGGGAARAVDGLRLQSLGPFPRSPAERAPMGRAAPADRHIHVWRPAVTEHRSPSGRHREPVTERRSPGAGHRRPAADVTPLNGR